MRLLSKFSTSPTAPTPSTSTLLAVPITPKPTPTLMSIPLVPLPLLLFPLHHLALTLQLLRLKLLSALLHTRLRFLEISRIPRVSTVLAAFPLWTKPAQVKRTQLVFLVVLQRTVWTEWTEAAVVVWARGALSIWVQMQIETVVAVGAGLCAGVVGAFGHAAEVVFVEEFAGFAFFAEAAQPVFTYETVVLSVSLLAFDMGVSYWMTYLL